MHIEKKKRKKEKNINKKTFKCKNVQMYKCTNVFTNVFTNVCTKGIVYQFLFILIYYSEEKKILK